MENQSDSSVGGPAMGGPAMGNIAVQNLGLCFLSKKNSLKLDKGCLGLINLATRLRRSITIS